MADARSVGFVVHRLRSVALRTVIRTAGGRHVGESFSSALIRDWRTSLGGTIPSELGRLTKLQHLEINAHFVDGGTELTFLSLFSNQVTGPLPSTIGALTSCTRLSLANNDLSGAVPVEIMNVPATSLFSIGGQSGCLSATDPALVAWLGDKDSGWDDGCRGNGNP